MNILDLRLIDNERVSSLQLLEIINKLRSEEYELKEKLDVLTEAEIKRGKFVKLEHRKLMNVIKDEFFDILGGMENKIHTPKECEYINEQNNQTYKYFQLTLSQAKQILIRESKYVRNKVIEYINKLEEEVYRLRYSNDSKKDFEWFKVRENGKLVRRTITDRIQTLIPYARQQGSKNYDKLYMTYSMLVNKLLGLKKGDRERVDINTLNYISQLEDVMQGVMYNEMEKGTHYKEIYQLCKKQGQQLVDIWSIGNFKVKYLTEEELELEKKGGNLIEK